MEFVYGGSADVGRVHGYIIKSGKATGVYCCFGLNSFLGRSL